MTGARDLCGCTFAISVTCMWHLYLFRLHHVYRILVGRLIINFTVGLSNKIMTGSTTGGRVN